MKNEILEIISYRKLLPQESIQYRFLRLESLQKYPNHFGSTYKQQQQKPKLAFQNFIEASNPESFIVGAIHSNNVIGICGFYRYNDERCRHRGEIIQMYVQPKYQNNTIGFNLLKATIKEAFKIEGLEQIELGVITSVQSANKIYEKAGFQECGIQRKFFKNEGVYFDHRLMILHREKPTMK